jgi:hypothetical protein
MLIYLVVPTHITNNKNIKRRQQKFKTKKKRNEMKMKMKIRRIGY